jgi:hypothetical protein
MHEINIAWLALEHERLHSVEEWPNSPRKQAMLAAIESTLDSLSTHPGADATFSCLICGSAKRNLKIMERPEPREPVPISTARTEWKKYG